MNDPVAYRASALLCPHCEQPLRPVTVPEAVVDLCDDCGGAWFDWHDGDAPGLAQALHRAPDRAAPDEPASPPGPCPRCALPLTAESFLGDGPVVDRCPGCLGLFAPSASLAALAALADQHQRAPSAPPSFWTRLCQSLRHLLTT